MLFGRCFFVFFSSVRTSLVISPICSPYNVLYLLVADCGIMYTLHMVVLSLYPYLSQEDKLAYVPKCLALKNLNLLEESLK